MNLNIPTRDPIGATAPRVSARRQTLYPASCSTTLLANHAPEEPSFAWQPLARLANEPQCGCNVRAWRMTSLRVRLRRVASHSSTAQQQQRSQGKAHRAQGRRMHCTALYCAAEATHLLACPALPCLTQLLVLHCTCRLPRSASRPDEQHHGNASHRPTCCRHTRSVLRNLGVLRVWLCLSSGSVDQ